MQTSEQIEEIATAMAAAQGQIEGAIKDSQGHNYKYADLSSVWEACRKPLTDNGLAIVQSPHQTERGVSVVTLMTHTSGQWIKDEFCLPPTKTDPQGHGSAITYMRRYALMAMVGIAPEDDDGNAASQSPAPANQTTQKRQPPKTDDVPQHVADAQKIVDQLKGAPTAEDLANVWDESAATLLSIGKESEATQKYVSDFYAQRETELKKEAA